MQTEPGLTVKVGVVQVWIRVAVVVSSRPANTIWIFNGMDVALWIYNCFLLELISTCLMSVISVAVVSPFLLKGSCMTRTTGTSWPSTEPHANTRKLHYSPPFITGIPLIVPIWTHISLDILTILFSGASMSSSGARRAPRGPRAGPRTPWPETLPASRLVTTNK